MLVSTVFTQAPTSLYRVISDDLRLNYVPPTLVGLLGSFSSRLRNKAHNKARNSSCTAPTRTTTTNGTKVKRKNFMEKVEKAEVEKSEKGKLKKLE